MQTTNLLRLSLAGVVAAASTACTEGSAKPTLAGASTDRAADASGVHRQYGEPLSVGQGRARAYVAYDEKRGGVPVEVGVALDERAMEGLPAPTTMAASHAAGHEAHVAQKNEHEHLDSKIFLLSLPPKGVAPYQFVELDWNPGGHEPPGIYDTPHFDFHFWTKSRDVRRSVDPSDPEFQAKADKLPPEAQRASNYVVAAPPGAPAPAVPLMGVHWVDTRSPELQGMFGNPEGFKPFTTTFIYGSWNGSFVFLEPMITRAFIMSKKTETDAAMRDQVIPISTLAQVEQRGWYPSAYRITFDAQAKEYRIALTNLAERQ